MGGHALMGALTYAAGQAFNLAFQLLLLRALGAQDYGRVGLAHLAFTTLIFVCDLGYGLFFLRERPDAPQWQNTWRTALGHRLLATIIGFAGLLGFWLMRYGSSDIGLFYLLAVIPAALAALINFSASLLAAGQQAIGFTLQQIAWPVAALCFVIGEVLHLALPTPLLAGASISVGYLVQAAVNLRVIARFDHGRQASALLLPRFGPGGQRILKASLTISLLGFLGVANDRLTAFLLEDTALSFLPAYLLLGQVLGGASGVLAQFNRLLVAHEADGHDSTSPVRILNGLLLTPMSLLFLLIVTGCHAGCWKLQPAWLQLGLPVLLDWTLSAIGGCMAAVLIGRHMENKLARVILLGVSFSIVAQLAGAWWGSAEAVLWAHIGGATVALVFSARLCGMAIPASVPLYALATLLGSLAQSGTLPWPVPTAAGILTLLVVLWQDAPPAWHALSAMRLRFSRRNNTVAMSAMPNQQAGSIGEHAPAPQLKPENPS